MKNCMKRIRVWNKILKIKVQLLKILKNELILRKKNLEKNVINVRKTVYDLLAENAILRKVIFQILMGIKDSSFW